MFLFNLYSFQTLLLKNYFANYVSIIFTLKVDQLSSTLLKVSPVVLHFYIGSPGLPENSDAALQRKKMCQSLRDHDKDFLGAKESYKSRCWLCTQGSFHQQATRTAIAFQKIRAASIFNYMRSGRTHGQLCSVHGAVL
jgi:hypothetical protein